MDDELKNGCSCKCANAVENAEFDIKHTYNFSVRGAPGTPSAGLSGSFNIRHSSSLIIVNVEFESNYGVRNVLKLQHSSWTKAFSCASSAWPTDGPLGDVYISCSLHAFSTVFNNPCMDFGLPPFSNNSVEGVK